MNYEVREECHSKFGGPVPEGKTVADISISTNMSICISLMLIYVNSHFQLTQTKFLCFCLHLRLLRLMSLAKELSDNWNVFYHS